MRAYSVERLLNFMIQLGISEASKPLLPRVLKEIITINQSINHSFIHLNLMMTMMSNHNCRNINLMIFFIFLLTQSLHFSCKFSDDRGGMAILIAHAQPPLIFLPSSATQQGAGEYLSAMNLRFSSYTTMIELT